MSEIHAELTTSPRMRNAIGLGGVAQRLMWPVFCLLAFGACDHGDDRPPTVVTEGGGPLVHRTNHLRWLQSPGVWVSQRTGLRSIDVLGSGEAASLSLLAQVTLEGCDESFPIAMAALDIDSDGQDELVIHDPGCGVWSIALEQGTWKAQVARSPF
jgi:hypothetical protein